MAENLLYFNTDEPQFPFGLMTTRLLWLPAYLSTHMSDRDPGVPLLNTVLVFSRARTAALLSMRDWNQVSRLAERLNAAAESIASHHKLELVPHSGMFFVTCRQSPRFQWTLPMSHYNIGRNLDYFAPGHMRTDPNEKTWGVIFIEKRSLCALTAEAVFHHALDNECVRNEFQRFNDVRVRLFNSAMEQLGLDYQFKCVVMAPNMPELIALTMANPSPPPPGWWDDNCYFVNGTMIPGVLSDTRFNFCGYQSKYNRYWPLIRLTFYFVLSYKRYEYHHSTDSTYWKSMESLLLRIKSICEQDIVEDLPSVFVEIEESFKSLVESAQLNPEYESDFQATIARQLHLRKTWSYRLDNLKNKCRVMSRVVYMHVFERFKLRPRLVRESVDYPPSGDAIVFRRFGSLY